MIKNDALHHFILGFVLEVSDIGFGRYTNIPQLWQRAKEKGLDCDMNEVLDALYTLQQDHAELAKFVPLGGGYQPVSFERVRNTARWSDFLLTGYFNIKVGPCGRVHFQRLSERIQREPQAPDSVNISAQPSGFVSGKIDLKKGDKGIGKWVWVTEDNHPVR
jgi:hypothetical protein